MRCLVLVSEEITDNQVPHIITHLFPELFKVFISADVYPKAVCDRLSRPSPPPTLDPCPPLSHPLDSPRGSLPGQSSLPQVRARTCTIIFKCVKLVSLLGDASDSEALSLQLLQQSAPAWFERFAQILSLPLDPEDAGELCVRIEILKILTVVIEHYPRLLSNCAGIVIQSIWKALVDIVGVYEQKVVFTSSPDEVSADPQDHMDGDRLSVETLVFELIECVREVVGCRHTAKLVQPELKPLVFMLIR